FIYREFSNDLSLEWKFYQEMQFAPSSSNKLKIYLAMDDPNPTSYRGYFIEIGENGNSDNWKLNAQLNSKIILLGQGELSRLASDPAKSNFNCSRKNDSIWIIKVDYNGGTNFSEITEIKDSFKLFTTKSYFGIQCIFTTTRADKFIFDDISVATPIIDINSPNIINVQILDDKSILVNFDEEVDTNSVKDVLNFSESKLGNPISVNIISNQTIELKFTQSMTLNSDYTLGYKNLSDPIGNKVNPEKFFSFQAKFKNYPKPNDLIINEFMADPDPVVSLPNAEFIEIYNSTSNSIDLEGIKISDGNSISASIKSVVIGAGDFLLLCATKDTTSFRIYGNTLGISSMPTLNNEGDDIIIYDRNNNIINKISYSSDWYNDETKKNGGYSIELQKPQKQCLSKNAWGASLDPTGGTPGRINSFIDNEQDKLAPTLISVIPISEWEISLRFDEALDELIMRSISNYSISSNISLASADLIEPDKSEIILLLNNPLQKGISYTLSIEVMKDCQGNESKNGVYKFEIPSEVNIGDILFNELLFNPVSGGVDFIEFYNSSNKLLTTDNLYLNNSSKDSKWIKINQMQLLDKNTYIVFTSDSKNILDHYSVHDSLRIFNTTIPSLDDDKGFVKLSRYWNGIYIVIDSIQYNQDWHNPLLPDKSGVSLEKINPTFSSNVKRNWTSASKFKYYGTPGLKNSQVIDSSNTKNKDLPFSLSSEVISPNSDNYRDELIIHLNLDKPGYKVNIKIYDLSGYEIKLISQDIIGTDDFIVWRGENNNDELVSSENYILF
ncbi:MAG: lamin tail domain-containing protein, partial [Saprospiraceae bacterium]